MEEAELHDFLRHTSIRLSARLRVLGRENLTKEQWDFVFAFLNLSLTEIKQEFKQQELIK